MKLLKKIFSRFSIVALTIILLFLIFVTAIVAAVVFTYFGIVKAFPNSELYVSAGLTVLSWLIVVITVLHAANRDMVPETKIPWILCIVGLNIFGAVIYIMFSSHKPSRRSRKLYTALNAQAAPFEGRAVSKEMLKNSAGEWAQVFEALSTASPSAVVYKGTKTQYFPSGETFLEAFLADLERAEKYIFLEYFIIERGACWNSILEVLERKVKEGVEVRVMYDDIGCMSKIHMYYHRTLRKKGIDCVKFNPFVPVVTNVHNNRDHRKIAVIDGKVGYTGGLNLADEYINAVHPFGHWKDAAVRLEGEGVKSLLLLFLRLYGMQTRRAEDFSEYVPASYEDFGEQGFVQPYGDGPAAMYGAHLAEDVYINVINAATEKLWITTPYLIIDYRMREALVLAAKRGVDVRILTPHIPDKKVPFALTRSNYLALIKGGVKVYEYTPGFVHAKLFLADSKVATIGTVNLDYRSFLFHFEDAVLLYGAQAVGELEEDLEATWKISALQTEDDAKKSVVWRWICEIAKIFAPLF